MKSVTKDYGGFDSDAQLNRGGLYRPDTKEDDAPPYFDLDV